MTAKDTNHLIIYQAESGEIALRQDRKNETIWANLNEISELFGRDKSVISRHLRSIFSSDELLQEQVVAKNATTGSDGKTYQVEYYNLDAIISVGYRVNSKTATRFRQWATRTLKQHITQGFTINPSRIEQHYEQFLEAVENIRKLSSGILCTKTKMPRVF